MKEEEKSTGLYSNEEVQSGIQEILNHSGFLEGVKKFLPEKIYNYCLSLVAEVKSIDDFQSGITSLLLRYIEQKSITELTVSGLENLQKEQKYLFISNHRDIILDSAYLNLHLFDHGIPTSQIAIGDNLMQHRISELLFFINKSFVVQRTGTPRELYAHSINLSKYILQTISEKTDSVWIAQAEGRAKDGNDKTQAGLLKMISLSGGKDLKSHFQALQVVPVSISYELDPTDSLKTKEYLAKLKNPELKKTYQEDLQSMLLGINGEKGKVHFNFGKPLVEELEIFDTLANRKEQMDYLAKLIDHSIHQNYKLNPINYVAYDLLFPQKKYGEMYNSEEWKKYGDYFDKKVAQLAPDEQQLGREYLLKMYANPLLNSEGYAPQN